MPQLIEKKRIRKSFNKKNATLHIGYTSGKLTIIEDLGTFFLNGNFHRKFKCLCECGKVCEVKNSSLISRSTKSCGCLKKERLPNNEGIFNRVLKGYKTTAKRKNRTFELTKEETRVLLQGNCVYCGSSPNSVWYEKTKNDFLYNGIDRVDNSKSYVMINCVSCCKNCNFSKQDSDVKSFFNFVKIVHANSEKILNQNDTKFILQEIKTNNPAVNELFANYKRSAKTRNFLFCLTKDEAFTLFSSNCFYCNAIPSNVQHYEFTSGNFLYSGIDRLDNNLNYTFDNVVPCCKRCNFAKHTLTTYEFLNHITKIYNFNNLAEYSKE